MTSLNGARLRCFMILTSAASMSMQRYAETSGPKLATFSVYLGMMMQPTFCVLYLKSKLIESYSTFDSILTELPVLTRTPYFSRFMSEFLKKGSSSTFSAASNSPYLVGLY